MNKNIEELKKANQGYTKQNAWTKLQIALCYIIPILEGFEKRLKKSEQWVDNCYKIDGKFKELKVDKAGPEANFEKRLKRIETELGIYTKEEIKKIKIGGTDPD